MAETDPVDQLITLWSAAMPEVDTRGLSVLGRARRVTQRARLAVEPLLAKHGLDGGGYDVLATLRAAPPPHRLRPTDLYRALAISSGGLTARLNKLEAARLIRRPAARDDRRSVFVELSPRGKQLVEQGFREEMAVQAQLISGLAEKEQWVLSTLLKKLDATMHQSGEPA
ncbi:MarR family winged helix-turn-helix transcriptional regulator [Sphingomonas psychrotolerans]|uniref:MarR family winged helix-turn-helix transcriptional regulator n=1 Tax=Sphingomonas psychrotolerans TaxID=1327635 RepID=A0ABU3N219_9SPHN|nr:MarR family winged helix-turn-helix transcriptional regulator [Sphingomonas psychrotolerans]MDT8758523.1 MarR family winged helix-turn-helix transcriptional regulator [Sphingomonas psychrotolerans]